MDKKETTISRKFVDNKTIIPCARFIFTSNFSIPELFKIFERRMSVIDVEHFMWNSGGCRTSYIPDNQLGLFDLSDEQLIEQLDIMAQDFTLDLISDEYTRQGASSPDLGGLDNIMIREKKNICLNRFNSF
jgi:hypothetical protein